MLIMQTRGEQSQQTHFLSKFATRLEEYEMFKEIFHNMNPRENALVEYVFLICKSLTRLENVSALRGLMEEQNYILGATTTLLKVR